MNLKLFYSPPKWLGFEAPVMPSWKLYHKANVPGFHDAIVYYEKAYAEAKANALEVGNEDAIMQKFYGSTSNLSDGVEFDWPGSAVIKDRKYILSV